MRYPLLKCGKEYFCAEHSAVYFVECIYNSYHFHEYQMLRYLINPIYNNLQTIDVFNVLIKDKNALDCEHHAMQTCRGHGDNTVCITGLGIKG